MKLTVTESTPILENVTLTIAEGGVVTVKGQKGEITRTFYDPQVVISQKDGELVVVAKDATRREKKRLFTYIAHIKNMMQGVTRQHVYKVKVCSGHFPMNVTVNNNELSVKNFLGEKLPRTTKITEGVSVKFEDNILTLTGCDKEKVGQLAASMEQLTRITNRDRRIFQDGLYIIDKDGKEM